MLIRRTAFVALVNTNDWFNGSTNLFFDDYRRVGNGRDTSIPLDGQGGPVNIECRVWTSSNNARDNITLTWQKWEGGAWITAPGSVAEGLPGGASGTYNVSSPVYSNPDYQWKFGSTGQHGDLAYYYSVCYLQFFNIKAEMFGIYRAVCTADYDGAGPGAAVTAYMTTGNYHQALEFKE
jgi:hypothetical protein